jgi:hypothetical protein
MGTNLRPAAGHYFFDALREVLGSFLCAPRLNPHRTAKRYRTVTKVLVGTKPTFLFRGGLLFLFPGNGVQCVAVWGRTPWTGTYRILRTLERSTLSGYGKRVKENLAQDFKYID